MDAKLIVDSCYLWEIKSLSTKTACMFFKSVFQVKHINKCCGSVLVLQVVSVLRPEEMFECVFTCGTDCKGTSLYPCLQIFVNNSESNSVALLHFDEQQLVLNPKVPQLNEFSRRDGFNSRIWLFGNI